MFDRGRAELAPTHAAPGTFARPANRTAMRNPARDGRTRAHPRTRAGSSGDSVEPVEDLLNHLSRVLVALRAALDLDEAALLQHPDRTVVARRDPGVERPLGDLGDQLREGRRREPAAPELPPDPVADEQPAVLFPAADVP